MIISMACARTSRWRCCLDGGSLTAMVHTCAPTCTRLSLALTWCLSLACGEVTTPGGSAGVERSEPEDTPVQRPLEPAPRPARGDAGRPPVDSAEDEDPGGDCDPNITVAGLRVTIGSPELECDELRVIATSPDFEERLACSFDVDRCRCFGVHERPGTYVITVETGDPPVELAQREVEVVMDEANCHVETRAVTFRVAAPGDARDGGVPAEEGEGTGADVPDGGS